MSQRSALRHLPPSGRPHPGVRHAHQAPAFRLAAALGVLAGLTLALALAQARGLALAAVAALGAAILAAALAQIVVGRALRRAERLTYHRAALAAVAVAALALAALGLPPLPYLDVAVLAGGLAQAIGRAGCLRAGCCYGRPARWGVRYSSARPRRPLPGCYHDVTLAPTQALDGLAGLAAVTTGALLVTGGAPAGAALASYALLYSLGRFGVELLRGDSGRRAWGALSEAQWVALILAACLLSAEALGALPAVWWHLAVGLALAAAARAVSRPGRARRNLLLGPRHTRELAVALRALPEQEGAARLQLQTSQGVTIWREPGADEAGRPCAIYHLSTAEPLGPATARALSSLVVRLCHTDARRAATLHDGVSASVRVRVAEPAA